MQIILLLNSNENPIDGNRSNLKGIRYQNILDNP
jgi:hypothetical protein